MDVIWETSFWVFFFLTVVIAGGASAAMGHALALHWRPFWQVILYAALLGCADRFLHWGLFLDYPLDVYKGTLFSLHYYLVDTAILVASATVAYRLTRVRQMVGQYPWLYRRSGPFSWRKREEGKG